MVFGREIFFYMIEMEMQDEEKNLKNFCCDGRI